MKIQTKPATKEYRDGWERTFGRDVTARKQMKWHSDPANCPHANRRGNRATRRWCDDCGTVFK